MFSIDAACQIAFTIFAVDTRRSCQKRNNSPARIVGRCSQSTQEVNVKAKSVIAVVVAGTTFSPSIFAKSIDVVASWCPGVEVITSTEVAPQQSIATYKVSGGLKWTPNGGATEMMNGVCHGHLALLGGPPSAAGNCLWVDKDGDKLVFSYSRSTAGPGKVNLTMGTGKFSGVRGDGEYMVVPLPPIPGTRNGCVESKFRLTLPE